MSADGNKRYFIMCLLSSAKKTAPLGLQGLSQDAI